MTPGATLDLDTHLMLLVQRDDTVSFGILLQKHRNIVVQYLPRSLLPGCSGSLLTLRSIIFAMNVTTTRTSVWMRPPRVGESLKRRMAGAPSNNGW
jgi:hypothetical protein